MPEITDIVSDYRKSSDVTGFLTDTSLFAVILHIKSSTVCTGCQ